MLQCRSKDVQRVLLERQMQEYSTISERVALKWQYSEPAKVKKPLSKNIELKQTGNWAK